MVGTTRLQVGTSSEYLHTRKVEAGDGSGLAHNEIVGLYSFESAGNTTTTPLAATATTSGHNSAVDLFCRFSLNEYQVT